MALVSEVMHRIEARLYPNYLQKGEGRYIARVKAEAPLSIENICAAAKNRGGFTGSYEDLVEHAHIFVNEMIYQLLDGFSMQISGFFSLHTKLSGMYHRETDRIDSDKITVSFRTLSHLKELLLKIKVENEGIAGDSAYIDEITDVHSGALNGTITPGKGNKIQVEGNDAAVGVWFVHQGDDSPVRSGNLQAGNRYQLYPRRSCAERAALY